MKNTGEFDIFNGISNHVTLVQLVYTPSNVNHVVSITGCLICYSNYKILVPLIKSYLNTICSTSKDEKLMYAEFKSVYYAVRYVNPKEKPANTE